MRELIRSNDAVRISFLRALLADAGIGVVVLDEHTSVLEGSVIALPRRLAVSEDDFGAAVRILIDAGEMPPDGPSKNA
ncbi:MAG: DUF2007 domain-containing protein [Alphaproteobacteria bacterium]